MEIEQGAISTPIWYATSKDGFHWDEQGVAIERPKAPTPGNRSVSTPDVLQWNGTYYLYYQGFIEAPYKSGGDFCPVMASVADSPMNWTKGVYQNDRQTVEHCRRRDVFRRNR
jgi:hypothetical protein